MIVITVARKPLEGTVAGNVQEYGVGGLNIDATRIGVTKEVPWGKPSTERKVFGA
jgi:site-specific DNA-methyltransferase (adenine-specific)